MKLKCVLAGVIVMSSSLVVCQEWVPYTGSVPENAIWTTNEDEGQKQQGLPVCRFRRTIGWLDVERNVCYTIGRNKQVKVRDREFLVLVRASGIGQVDKNVLPLNEVNARIEKAVSAATAGMVSRAELEGRLRGERKLGYDQGVGYGIGMGAQQASMGMVPSEMMNQKLKEAHKKYELRISKMVTKAEMDEAVRRALESCQ